MKAAQQVHRVGQVAAAVRTGRFEQAVEIGMARATLARDAGKLRFGNADRLGWSTDRLIAILLPSAVLIRRSLWAVPNPRA